MMCRQKVLMLRVYSDGNADVLFHSVYCLKNVPILSLNKGC